MLSSIEIPQHTVIAKNRNTRYPDINIGDIQYLRILSSFYEGTGSVVDEAVKVVVPVAGEVAVPVVIKTLNRRKDPVRAIDNIYFFIFY